MAIKCESTGRGGFNINLRVTADRIGCELYMHSKVAKKAYPTLYEQRESIESELGGEIEWPELPNKKAGRILQHHPADLKDEAAWPELFSWFKERAEAFHKTFSERVGLLELEDD